MISLRGTLQIDSKRGIVAFLAEDTFVTVLQITGLPCPIPFKRKATYEERNQGIINRIEINEVKDTQVNYQVEELCQS